MMPESIVVDQSPHSMPSGGSYHVKLKPRHDSQVKILGMSIGGHQIYPGRSTRQLMDFRTTLADDSLKETDLHVEMSVIDRAHEEAREAEIITFRSGEMNEGAVWPPFVVGSLQEANLQAALSDLDSTVEEAREEGFDTLPSDEVITSARRILQKMYEIHRCRFEVYPTQDGEIAISASAENQRSVLVICDKDGGALCSVNLSGLHRRAIYDSAATLPDGFVKEALAELV